MFDEVSDLVEKLSFEIDNFEDALSRLRSNVDKIQTGDQEKSYWNGNLAYGWIKSVLANIDHNKVLDENLRECLSYLKENKM